MIQPPKIRFAEAVYNSASKRPFRMWALPGLFGLSIWAEETLREYRSKKKKQEYRELRAQLTNKGEGEP